MISLKIDKKEQLEWIPTDKYHPADGTRVFVTVENPDGSRETKECTYRQGQYLSGKEERDAPPETRVVAWREVILPEPYRIDQFPEGTLCIGGKTQKCRIVEKRSIMGHPYLTVFRGKEFFSVREEEVKIERQ